MVLLEMRCPWVSNREIKCAEKTSKYAPLRCELRRRYPGYKTGQHNIIIDALRGSSRSVKESLRQLVGSGRCNSVLRNMQKAVVSSSLNIALNIDLQGPVGLRFQTTLVLSIVLLGSSDLYLYFRGEGRHHFRTFRF